MQQKRDSEKLRLFVAKTNSVLLVFMAVTSKDKVRKKEGGGGGGDASVRPDEQTTKVS